MSELRKAKGDSLYFVTFTIVGWIDLFTRKAYCEEAITNLNNLKFCQQHKRLRIYSYCIMPSHLHLIISHDDSKLPDIIRNFKSYTAKRLLEMIENESFESRRSWLLYVLSYYATQHQRNAKYQLWQATNHPIELMSNAVIDQKAEYIHQNPVVAGIVDEAHHYIYSSANPFSPLEVELI